jgi:hypothetical protein
LTNYPHPLDQKPPYATYAGVVALVFIATAAVLVVSAARSWRIAWLFAAPVAVAAVAGALLGAWAVLRVTYARQGNAGSWLVPGASMGALLGSLIGLAVSVALRRSDFALALGSRWFLRAAVASAVLGASVGLVVWLLERLRSRQAALLGELERQRAAALVLERRRAESDLQTLCAQLEPHFLFNTLANLRALIAFDPQAATRMLEQLIAYFRLALPTFQLTTVALERELQLCVAYVGIMQLRTERQLYWSDLVSPDARDLEVPGCSVLTLVENAIKHNDSQDALTISITAQTMEGCFTLEVTDNGTSTLMEAAPNSSGTGLANLRERLKLIHGENARVDLTRVAPQGMRATLRLPLRSAKAAVAASA